MLAGLVARYLGRDGGWVLARRCALCDGPHGKPHIVVGGDRSPLELSVSHSASVSVYAFTTAGSIGVDVEVVQARFDWAAVTGVVASPGERRRLEQARPEARPALFLQMWVAKEAVLKGEGVGLAGPVREVDTSDVTGLVWDAWHVQRLDLGAGTVGALACRAGPLEISVFDLEPDPGIVDGPRRRR